MILPNIKKAISLIIELTCDTGEKNGEKEKKEFVYSLKMS